MLLERKMLQIERLFTGYVHKNTKASLAANQAGKLAY